MIFIGNLSIKYYRKVVHVFSYYLRKLTKDYSGIFTLRYKILQLNKFSDSKIYSFIWRTYEDRRLIDFV